MNKLTSFTLLLSGSSGGIVYKLSGDLILGGLSGIAIYSGVALYTAVKSDYLNALYQAGKNLLKEYLERENDGKK